MDYFVQWCLVCERKIEHNGLYCSPQCLRRDFILRQPGDQQLPTPLAANKTPRQESTPPVSPAYLSDLPTPVLLSSGGGSSRRPSVLYPVFEDMVSEEHGATLGRPPGAPVDLAALSRAAARLACPASSSPTELTKRVNLTTWPTRLRPHPSPGLAPAARGVASPPISPLPPTTVATDSAAAGPVAPPALVSASAPPSSGLGISGLPTTWAPTLSSSAGILPDWNQQPQLLPHQTQGFVAAPASADSPSSFPALLRRSTRGNRL
ncbi:hypothetical protein HK405_000651 [Cladochytrium tenue]|nr:hypothetical protein HK405_000651 [Cladochytrium tenue]